MSMIGSFGMCSKSTYDSLLNLIRSNQFDRVESLINKINSELEASVSEMTNDKCSGEVFIALFDYFETALGINVRENIELEEVGENWREVTGDCDMIAFSEKEKSQFLALADTIDYNAVAQFINDFFQNDYEDAGQIACNVFLENLGKLDANTVLIFRNRT